MFSISTLVPIIDAGILCASSTTFSIEYIDSLYLCQRGDGYWACHCGLECAHTVATSYHCHRLSRLKSGAFRLLIGFRRAWSWLW
jgi:hypothetical protein